MLTARMTSIGTLRVGKAASVPGPALLTRLRNQQELAGGTARLQEAHSLCGLGERERLADWNRKATLMRQLENRVETATMDLAHPVDHRDDETADFERFREQVAAKVDWIRRSAGAAVKDQMAEGRKAGETLLERRLPDRVERSEERRV